MRVGSPIGGKTVWGRTVQAARKHLFIHLDGEEEAAEGGVDVQLPASRVEDLHAVVAGGWVDGCTVQSWLDPWTRHDKTRRKAARGLPASLPLQCRLTD